MGGVGWGCAWKGAHHHGPAVINHHRRHWPAESLLLLLPQGKMGKIHGRLGRVEANPSIFNEGGGAALGRDAAGAKGTIFDVDFGGNL